MKKQRHHQSMLQASFPKCCCLSCFDVLSESLVAAACLLSASNRQSTCPPYGGAVSSIWSKWLLPSASHGNSGLTNRRLLDLPAHRGLRSCISLHQHILLMCRVAEGDKQVEEVAMQLRQSTRQLIHLVQQLSGALFNTIKRICSQQPGHANQPACSGACP